MKQQDWEDVITIAFTNHDNPTKQQMLEIARAYFPNEMLESESAATRRGHLDALANALREARGLCATDDLDWSEIPGFEHLHNLPIYPHKAFVTVRDELGKLVVVRYICCTRSQRRQAIDERKKVVRRIQHPQHIMETIDDFLDCYSDGSESTEDSILEALIKIYGPKDSAKDTALESADVS